MKKSRAVFSDCTGENVDVASSWRGVKASHEMECQTSPSLYEFENMDIQSGRFTQVEQFSVEVPPQGQGEDGKDRKAGGAGTSTTLIDYLRKVNRSRSREEMRALIETGYVTVDEAVVCDPRHAVQDKDFIEVVVCRRDAETQTKALRGVGVEVEGGVEIGDKGESKSSSSESKHGGGEGEGKGDDGDDYGYDDDFGDDGDGDGGESKGESKSGGGGGGSLDRALESFLGRVAPLVETELASNLTSRAFDGFDFLSGPQGTEEVTAWRTLSVDLEKHRVTYPGWTDARHYGGRVTRCSQTRNKERIYDVVFDDDGSTLVDVREEHIRVVSAESLVSPREYWAAQEGKRAALRAGVRVHVAAASKDSRGKKASRHVPARVTKVIKGGLVDVELEGGHNKEGVPLDQVLVGLDEGMVVEGRRPTRQELHCTGVSWNATGNSIASSFGRTDMAGWCDLPGAVCVWSVFGAAFDRANPDVVLDHPSCLNCVRWHPERPAIVAAGSFNGEVVVWDVSSPTPEEPIGLSPIVEYCHKEPVLDVQWAFDATRQEWTVLSVGADGKVLQWELGNKLRHPIKGSVLSKPGCGGKSSRKEYPLAYGGTALSLSGGTSAVAGSSLSRRPKWVLVGQEGGAIVRTQAKRALALGGKTLTKEDFKAAARSGAELYASIRGSEVAGEGFRHEPHIGPVSSIDGSPFHRSLFLTGGRDGSVRLYHVLESAPLLQWEPSPPPGTSGVDGAYGAITAAAFSPIRPCVFAAASSDGFVYIFDLSVSTAAPCATLEAEAPADGGRSARRPALTDVCFNPKQRDLLAAADKGGRVHTWRLGWTLSNRQMNDQAALDAVALLATSAEAE